MKNIIEMVNVNSESDDNGGRQMIEKRMSLPCIITLCLCPHCLAEKRTVSEMGIPANMMVCETQV